MVIAAMNSLYLIIQTSVFFVYLVMICIAFIHWRKTHFDIEVTENILLQNTGAKAALG